MKVLIIEDNLALSQTLKETLLQKGYEANTANSWKTASQLMETKTFDLFIIDIILPDKKGIDILNILVQKKLHILSQIVVISGFFDKASVQKNMPQTLKDKFFFLKKPIDETELLNALSKLKNHTYRRKPLYPRVFF